MQRTKRTATRTTDRDGTAIVLMPLANHHAPAKLLATDWDRLTRDKVSPQWTFNMANGRSYVRCVAHRPGNLDTVARLIMGAGAGQIVGYRSADRLNLRRDNLHIKARSVGRRRTPQF